MSPAAPRPRVWIPPLYIEGMNGLGDCVYQVPIVRGLCAKWGMVYLRTPWPQLYAKEILPTNLRFIDPSTRLRTQARNAVLSRGLFSTLPAGRCHRVRLSYVEAQRRGIPLYRGLCASVGFDASKYFLSLGQPVPLDARSRVAVIRPATLRQEWMAPSRNPRQEYVQHCIDRLNAGGFKTIVVCDVAPPYEDYADFRPTGASAYYEYGELGTAELLTLLGSAALVVGGVGFIAPMCQALGTPALILHGGAGGWNGPGAIDVPGAEGKLTHVLPIRYCLCRQHVHNCDKQIDLLILDTKLNYYLKLHDDRPALQEA